MNLFKTRTLLAGIITSLLLLGCGGGGGSTTSTSPSTSTTASTELPKVVEIQTNEPIITENSATIEWIENDYTVELIEYGTSENYGSELLVQTQTTINYKRSTSELAVTLSDLEADTTYNYRIVGKDKNGKKVLGKNKNFTTPESEPTPEPIIEPTPEPIIEPTPVPEPIVEPTPEPIVEPTPVPEPIVEPTPEPIIEPTPVPKPIVEPTPEPIIEPTPVPEPIIEPTPEPIPVCISGPAMHQGQITDSTSGTELADVLVTIDGCSTTTDLNGFYTLHNIAENTHAVVNFEKEGYLLGSTRIQIKELSEDNSISSNYLEYAIDAYNYQWSHDSQTRRTGAHIDIPASIYTDTEGNLYTGTVAASLEYRNVTTNKGRASFTGSFEGMNTNGQIVPFVSYGFISLSFKDANGKTLNITSDSGTTLTFDAVPSLEEQNIIPIWYYDDVQGIWIEEGYAELQSNGTYKGDISHSGTWSLNKPIETDPGIYRGRIIDNDGSPMSDVRLQAIGDNWISSDLTTDEDGVFEIEVIPGKSFKLAAYNYKDKYSASYNNIISAIASGDIVED